MLQAAWNAILALTAVARGATQEGLCGVLLLSALHAIAPASGTPCPPFAEVARVVVTTGLQSAALASVMQRVVPQLCAEEKARLRQGLRQASSGTGVLAHGAEVKTGAAAPLQINFAAFRPGRSTSVDLGPSSSV